MTTTLFKYHGCGNDFICLDCRDQSYDLQKLAQIVCRRGFHIGADGVIGLYASDDADFKMVIVNSDGSIPQMCGNGIRCFAAFILDQQLASGNLSIETDAGILSVQVLFDDGLRLFRVGMGQAKVKDALPQSDFNLPVDSSHYSYHLNGQTFSFFRYRLVILMRLFFVDDVDAVSLQDVGPVAESHPFFPNRVNTEFVEIIDNHHIKMRVWERGVGETNACGTGACASVVAGIMNAQLSTPVTVHLTGGDLLIEFNASNNQVFMNGPAEFVFSTAIDVSQWFD